MAELTGSEILAKCLAKEGVKDIFYIMGGPMLLAEATCITEGIRMIDVRHEQAAAFACQAYSRLKQVPSVCMAASGPGVTNLITGMAHALVDCAPVVAFGGSSPISQFGRQVFQEIDQVELMRGCCKHVDRVHNLKRIPQHVNWALQKAITGKPGPVYVDMPGDILYQKIDENLVDWSYAGRPIMDSRPLGDPRQRQCAGEGAVGGEAAADRVRLRRDLVAGVERDAAARRGCRHPVLHHTARPRRGAGRSSVLVPRHAQHGVRGCRPDHRARHADELHHRPRRTAALRRQCEDRAHRHRSEGDRHGRAPRRYPHCRRLQDGAAAGAGRHQGQGHAGQLQGVAAEAGGRRGGEAARRRQQVRRGWRHPSGAHARGGEELREARRDPVRRWAGDAEFRPPDDADISRRVIG